MPENDDVLDRASTGEPVKLTVREFIGRWNAKRRGYRIVDKIRTDLEKRQLTTTPPFTDGWIDAVITIERVPASTTAAPEKNDQLNAVAGTTPNQVTLQVRSLESANSGVVSVSPNTELKEAQTLMMSKDYSQLAVVSGQRDLRGAVSWESIARARALNPGATLTDATVPTNTVRPDDDLLAQIPMIAEAGYVFVVDKDRSLSGIVTTADLSLQFAELATPFLVLAEIERRVRRLIDDKFESEELQAGVAPDDPGRSVTCADDLTFGEYKRLLEKPDNWERLGLNLERTVFIKSLDEVREIRNEIMHFSPDPLEAAQNRTLRNFVRWLRQLVPTP